MGWAVGGTDPDVGRHLEGVINRGESMTRVDEVAVLRAAQTVVPVGAVQALVSDSLDLVLTAIANGTVLLVATRGKAASHLRLKASSLNGGDEAVLGVVAVTVLGEACPAEIIVVAGGAVDELDLGQLLDAAVACPHAREKHAVENGNDTLLGQRGRRGKRCGSGSYSWSRSSLRLGCQAFRRAVDNDAVVNAPLDKPVLRVIAHLTLVDALQAEVVVAIVASRAVEMGSFDHLVTPVAAHGVVRVAAKQARGDPSCCETVTWPGHCPHRCMEFVDAVLDRPELRLNRGSGSDRRSRLRLLGDCRS